MACAAQCNARIFELRRHGFTIENRTETNSETGARHSWFCLIASTAVDTLKPESPHGTVAPSSGRADWFTEKTGRKRPVVAPESLFLWERRQ